MKFFQSQNERILAENPWLYAVKPYWYQTSRLRVQEMREQDTHLLRFHPIIALVEVWRFISGEFLIGHAEHCSGSDEHRLAELLEGNLPSGRRVERYALLLGNQKAASPDLTIVVRPARGVDLHRLIVDVAREERAERHMEEIPEPA